MKEGFYGLFLFFFPLAFHNKQRMKDMADNNDIEKSPDLADTFSLMAIIALNTKSRSTQRKADKSNV